MTWFFDLKTSLKMVISFGTLLAFALGIAWQGHAALSAARGRQSATVDIDLQATHLADAIAVHRAMIAKVVRDAVLETEGTRVAADLEEKRVEENELRGELDELDKLTTDAPSRRELDEVRRVLIEWNALNQVLVASRGNGPAVAASIHTLGALGAFINERMGTVAQLTKTRADERARAGEAGFAHTQVVDAVLVGVMTLLAQRTGTAAKEIRVLIADSGSKVQIGTHEVNKSGATLAEIVHSVKRVTDMVAEIAAASREQSTGVEQVNTAVTQVDQVTQLNATQTEELSATASSLSSKAAAMRELVARFDLGVVDEVVEDRSFVAPPTSAPVSRLRVVAAARPTVPAGLRAAAAYEEF